MAVKNFSRHMPRSHDTPSEWGKKDKEGAPVSDRLMGAAGEAAALAAAGSQFGPAGTVIGGTVGAIKGFFGTGKGKGAGKLVDGGLAGARALAAQQKLGPEAAEGSVGKVKKDSKDGFFKKGERVTKTSARSNPEDDFTSGY
tara:strand:+ start:9151 stop:9576 length:426 start_codon:yes stop_codon:yes gene_type:complete